MRELIQHIREADVFKPASRAELKHRGTYMDNTHIFVVNIWDFMDIDALNSHLDDLLATKNISPMEINYNFKTISRNGDAKIEATFEPEVIE